MSATTRNTITLTLAIGLGFALGRTVEFTRPAAADTRESPKREAFKSGGARSEVVLREISATLGRIEKRVESIEKAVTPKP